MKQRPDATGVHAHMLLPQTGEPPARLAIDVLGRFDAAIGDEPVAAERWPSLRAAHLVQLLALQPRQRMSRDLAIDALWPQLDPDAGAANLRKALHHGRQALGRHDGITLLGGELVLWPERPVRVDADTFEQQARTALRESGRDFGTAHISDGPLHLKFELPKKVSWDQKQLAEIAERIVASGEKVEGYLDIKLSVSESRFTNWPPALQQQFAAARTVDSGKPSFTLSIDSE